MPWKAETPMEQKQRFVSLAESGHFTVTELCREFGISRQEGPVDPARHQWHKCVYGPKWVRILRLPTPVPSLK